MFTVILFVAQTHNLFLCGLSANHSTTEPPTKTFLIVLSCFSFRAVRLCRLLQCHRVVGDNTVALTEMRGCGQIVKSTFLPFPKNFFLTSMENTIRSQKDVKENSDGLMKKKSLWCTEKSNCTCTRLLNYATADVVYVGLLWKNNVSKMDYKKSHLSGLPCMFLLCRFV